jgi:hypothetical protein
MGRLDTALNLINRHLLPMLWIQAASLPFFLLDFSFQRNRIREGKGKQK